MATGIRYRIASVAGTAVLSISALLVANLATVQRLATTLPFLDRLPPTTMGPDVLPIAAGTVLLVQFVALAPQFEPRPRRILDTVAATAQQVLVATFALATIGYFDYTYRLPRTTLLLTTGVSLVLLPAWFVTIRGRDAGTDDRSAIIAGDDADRIAAAAEAAESVEGYVAPNHEPRRDGAGTVTTDGGVVPVADGVDGLDRLGGLSRLDDVIVDNDVDVALLAFARSDRGEFFGALEKCYARGLTAMVHRDHVDSVLTSGIEPGPFVRVHLDPIDWQDHFVKRTFDVAFASAALLALCPALLVIALAIWLDDRGPIFYRQERSAALGQTFTVYKFRTMAQADESAVPSGEGENDRVTRVGRALRRSHLDEVPQLWSILVGDMSVVGPRAAWTDEEELLESDVPTWRKRWFVKPGLTGLAQINEATSTEPERKLQYDLEYIRRQSFVFDCKIVARQLWSVGGDVWGMIAGCVRRR